MINKFLKAKHWQLFILMIVIPMIFQFILMGKMIVNIDFESDVPPDPKVIFDSFKYFPIMMLFFMFIFYGWFWSIAIGLQSKIPKEIKMKVTKFKILFFIPLAYFVAFAFFIVNFLTFFSPENIDNIENNTALIGSSMLFIFPLHFLAMFCVFYMMYFVAKTIKTVELQKEVSFGDFIGEFFLLWFYIIGLWILQPKINKMVEQNNN